MAAHRYWRALNLAAYGLAGLALSEFQLFASGVRVDASATLTSNVAPASGSLANLKDDNTATGAEWPQTAVTALILSWDFGGSPQDVTNWVVAGTDDATKFLHQGNLQWSDDSATWTTYDWGGGSRVRGVTGIVWPGAFTKTSSAARSAFRRQDAAGFSIDSTGLVATNFAMSAVMPAYTPRSSGVRQFEIVQGGTNSATLGVQTALGAVTGSVGSTADGFGVFPSSGQKNNSGVAAAYGTSGAVGTVWGVVVDFSAGTITFYKNGVSMGVAYTNALLTGEMYPAIGGNTSTIQTATAKFSGFTFPIAGASAWGDGESIIRTDVAIPLRAGGGMGEGIQVTTPLASYGQTIGTVLGRLRGDFQLGALGLQVGRVQGTTKDKATPSNIPVSERVRLYREKDGLLLREVWSTPGTGAYSFDYIDELETYTVLSYDHDKAFRAVVADGLNLANGGVELMP